MNISFSVCMMLESVNRMGPGIKSAQRMLGGFSGTIKNVAERTKNINPVQGWAQKIDHVSDVARAMGRELKEAGKNVSSLGEKMQNKGLRNVTEGVGILAPLVDAANKAGELQMKMTSMRMSGISKPGVAQLMEKADKYTERTLFGKAEIADMFLTMRQSGMNEKNILRGSERMVMLAELENIRRGTEGTETAKVLAQMAERGGILQDPNIKRWHEFLELVNQVTTVTTAGMPELHESSKYLEPVARAAGWSEKDMMWSQGIAARFGLEGSVAGTDLKDMIARLNPQKWLKEGRPSQQLDAMNRLGWLKNVQSHVTKNGRTAYDNIGSSVMLDKKGNTVNMLTMFGQFAKSWEKYKDLPQGRAKFAADMHKVLGEQGEKTALLVSQNYEVIEQMMEDAKKIKSINGQIIEYSDEYLQNYRAFKEAIANLQVDLGNAILPSATDFIQNTLRPWIQSLRNFAQENPKFISSVAKGLAIIGGLKIGIGVLRLVAGTLGTAFGGIVSGAGRISSGIGKIILRFRGLYDGFKYFRTGEGKFFESLWKGAQFAFPWFGKSLSIGRKIGGVFKIGGIKGLEKLKSLIPLGKKLGGVFKSGGGKAIGWILRLGKTIVVFTAGWLVQAARIAVGWLIAMGPVGWVILGVTALIVAGIILWKTNFMGFRDKCIYVWNAISSWGKKTWIGITGFVKTAIDRVSGFIDRVRTALGLASQLDNQHALPGPIQRQPLKTPDIPYLNPDRGNKTNKFYQKNNITVKDIEEAAKFVRKSPPPKYTLGNPQFNLPK